MRDIHKNLYNITQASCIILTSLLFLQLSGHARLVTMSLYEVVQNDRFANIVFMIMMINILNFYVLYKNRKVDNNIHCILTILAYISMTATFNLLGAALYSIYIYKNNKRDNIRLKEFVKTAIGEIKDNRITIPIIALGLFLISTLYLTIFINLK